MLGSVLFAGLWLDNAVGGVLLLILALFLAWLASLGWSHVSPRRTRPAPADGRRAGLRGGRQVPLSLNGFDNRFHLEREWSHASSPSAIAECCRLRRAGRHLALSACSSRDGQTPDVQPTTRAGRSPRRFYPLQFVAEAVGGDLVTVTNLTKPGAEPHDLELAPQDLAELTDADLAVYLDGFQPAVDDAVAQKTDGAVLDVSAAADLSLTTAGDDHGGEEVTDPHFWLDPMRLADVGDAVADSLSQLDPPAQATFDANAATLRTELERLDASYRKGLGECEQSRAGHEPHRVRLPRRRLPARAGRPDRAHPRDRAEPARARRRHAVRPRQRRPDDLLRDARQPRCRRDRGPGDGR